MENNKVYTCAEMREMMIDTSDYSFMDEVGEFTGTLEMKAEAKSGMLRIFLRLSDDRKIITPVFWWQKHLGFYEMEIGTQLRLYFRESAREKIYLAKVEVLENE